MEEKLACIHITASSSTHRVGLTDEAAVVGLPSTLQGQQQQYFVVHVFKTDILDSSQDLTVRL